MTQSHSNSLQTEAFKLKMRSLTLPVLQILDNNVTVIEKQLEALKIKAPNLFQLSPMVLDVDAPHLDTVYLSLEKLCSILRQYGIIPVGVQMNAKDENPFLKETLKMGMAVFSASSLKEWETKRKSTDEVRGTKPILQNNPTKLVTKPVRSGQQVYAEGGDLIVVSSVSAGAELLADGNIHVYGCLRGRALAGIQGNTYARIFCQELEADLLSIAGFYMVSETIDRCRKQGVQQIYLDDEKLQIEAL